MAELRKYNVLLTDTTAIYLNLLKYATPTDFAVAADWPSPVAADVKVSKDGGAAASITTAPSYVTDKGWKFILTAAELSCQQLVVRIADAATKLVCDDMFVVETFADPSAMYPDPDASNPIITNAVQFSGSATAADNAELAFIGTGLDLSASTISLSSTERAAVADAVWDELVAGHVVAESFGIALQIFSGTVGASSGATTTLASPVPAVTSALVNWSVAFLDNGVVTSVHKITAFTSGRVATLDPTPTTTPTSGSTRYMAFRN